MTTRLIPIDDPDDQRLIVYRNQRDAWLKAAHNPDAQGPTTPTGLDDPGLFMTESPLVLDQHLRSSYPVESVLVAQNRADALAALLDRVPETVPIYAASRDIMSELTGFAMHRGILAAGRRQPEPTPLEIARTRKTLVVLENTANHDNTGSIFRTVAALAGDDGAVLLSPGCCDPLYRKSLRVSIGCALRIPFATLDPFHDGLKALKDDGVLLIAMTPASGSQDIETVMPELNPNERVALLLGAEGPGLEDATMAICDLKVRIPITDWVDSLNIAVSGAVALSALASRRRSSTSQG